MAICQMLLLLIYAMQLQTSKSAAVRCRGRSATNLALEYAYPPPQALARSHKPPRQEEHEVDAEPRNALILDIGQTPNVTVTGNANLAKGQLAIYCTHGQDSFSINTPAYQHRH